MKSNSRCYIYPSLRVIIADTAFSPGLSDTLPFCSLSCTLHRAFSAAPGTPTERVRCVPDLHDEQCAVDDILILLPSSVTYFPRTASARLDIVDPGLCSQSPIGNTPPVRKLAVRAGLSPDDASRTQPIIRLRKGYSAKRGVNNIESQ